MSETKEREKEIGLRLIGLCMVYIRGLERGSEREREAYGMLAVYRDSYRRETGEDATELMVVEAMRRRRAEMEGKEEAVANSCNQYKHEEGCTGATQRAQKGSTREKKTPGENRKVYKLNQRQSMHNQIRDLSQIIERSSRDGGHMEAVLYRPEFGELTLDCGRPGRKNDSTDSHGHGVKHALEERHKISPQQIAQTLLGGNVEQHESFPSRLYVSLGDQTVVLEREIQAGSKRSSAIRAKLHTAYAGKK